MKHNKKRNIGLVYEFLIKTVANSIIENNENKKNIALKILKKHYKPGTEINKEFKLFHSLVETNASSDSVANSILLSSRHASKEFFNHKKLEREKSLLIKEINHNIDNKDFYAQNVNDYKIYATIQTLLNEWRKKESFNIVKIAEYEGALKEHLLTKKEKQSKETNIKPDPLVERLLFKKINEKYKSLNPKQKELIKEYAFSNKRNLSKTLDEIKKNVLNNIDQYLKENVSKDKKLEEKLNKVKDLVILESTDTDEVPDEKMNKFMDLINLSHEIMTTADGE